MYIKRDLETKLRDYLNTREVLAIVGPRQCGKTTLMEHVFKGLKNARFISFEDREALELFSKDINAFADLYAKGVDYLFIDEFQYARRGGKQLKYLYDSLRTKIIISGSSAPELSVQSLKYLVGRIFILNLYPLSFGEYLRYKDPRLFGLYAKSSLSEAVVKRVNKHYEEFAVYGGYPRVALAESPQEKKEVLKNIYNTYLLREIREILQLPDDFKLSQLMKILALQAGGIVNYNELSSSSGMPYHELKRSLNVLVKTFVCAESRPFFTNKKKELVKAPRVFFLDNGFRNVIAGSFQPLADRPDSGQLNENFVASELVKSGVELRYWRTKAKAEVDFIVESEGKIFPVEVKSRLSGPKLTRSFKNFLEEYRPEKGFVLSSGLVGKKKAASSSVEFLPVFAAGSLKRPAAPP